MEIRRDFYLDKLIRRKNNGLIKVITGIRRCGKSYLLNNIFYNHLLESGVPADHIIRFAFDSADDLVFKFSFAVANISLIRFNWFTSLAPGS